MRIDGDSGFTHRRVRFLGCSVLGPSGMNSGGCVSVAIPRRGLRGGVDGIRVIWCMLGRLGELAIRLEMAKAEVGG